MGTRALFCAFLLLLFCASSSAVIPGVQSLNKNGVSFHDTIFQVAIEDTENVLWAIGSGGILYKIDGVSMNVTSTLQLPLNGTGASTSTGLFVDDANNTVYVLYVSPTNLYPFIISSSTNSLINSCTPFSPIFSGLSANLNQMLHFFDITTQKIGCLAYTPNSGAASYTDFTVIGNTCNSVRTITILGSFLSAFQMFYVPSTDTIAVPAVGIIAGTFYEYVMSSSQSGLSNGDSSSFNPKILSHFGPPLHTAAPPYDFSSTVSGGNLLLNADQFFFFSIVRLWCVLLNYKSFWWSRGDPISKFFDQSHSQQPQNVDFIS